MRWKHAELRLSCSLQRHADKLSPDHLLHSTPFDVPVPPGWQRPEATNVASGAGNLMKSVEAPATAAQQRLKNPTKNACLCLRCKDNANASCIAGSSQVVTVRHSRQHIVWNESAHGLRSGSRSLETRMIFPLECNIVCTDAGCTRAKQRSIQVRAILLEWAKEESG